MASTLIQTLYSQNHWTADGSQTVYNFSFAGNPTSLTYLDRAHVKAFWQDVAGSKTYYTFVDADWLGDYQLNVVPAPPAGQLFVIYRDTPKDKPWVDFADGAAVSEVSLDDTAKQAVFIAAEFIDGAILDTSDLGFKAMKHNEYTGASSVVVGDNGKSHYKEDGTAVDLDNADIPITFLTTIINNSDDPMDVTFTDATAYLQGTDGSAPADAWVLAPRNTLSVTKVSDGIFFISGNAA